jgi:hypothetical protein
LWDRYRVQCSVCESRGRHAREQEIYAKATKVPIKEYTGEWLYCDDDRYFASLDELLDHYYDDSDDDDGMPAWAWGTTEQRPSFSAVEMMHGEMENGEYPEDYYDQVDDKDLEAMQVVLDKMAEGMHPYYNADHKTVVTFEEERDAYLKRREERSI